MDNPNEFAAVLAHEMAHVEERHPTVAYIRVMGFSAILSIIAGGSDIFETLGEAGGLLAMLSYSRTYEADADRLAFKQLAAQEIDPRGLATLFRKMEKKKEKKKKATTEKNKITIDITDYFSTHPGTETRIAAAEAEFAKHGHTGSALSAADWQAVKQICS
jgi:predicted Zn-dependent protease